MIALLLLHLAGHLVAEIGEDAAIGYLEHPVEEHGPAADVPHLGNAALHVERPRPGIEVAFHVPGDLAAVGLVLRLDADDYCFRAVGGQKGVEFAKNIVEVDSEGSHPVVERKLCTRLDAEVEETDTGIELFTDRHGLALDIVEAEPADQARGPAGRYSSF